jgi:hypothetical protein
VRDMSEEKQQSGKDQVVWLLYSEQEKSLGREEPSKWERVI